MEDLPGDIHDVVLSPAARQLAEIHWHLVKAADLMDEARYRRRQDGSGFSTQETTDFGHEVGPDEIGWWIFKKEKELSELGARTQVALDATQRIKRAADQLKGQRWESYEALLQNIVTLVESHADEVSILHEYVSWLSSRDQLLPSILFAYRVWGSTRKGERSLHVKANSPGAEDTETIKRFVEVVLGLRSAIGNAAWDRAYIDTGSTRWDDGDVGYRPSHDQVLPRAAWMIVGELTEYFELVRDSLRNILLDIQKRVDEETLLTDEAFWRRLVGRAMEDVTENQLWDFKQVLPMWVAGTADARQQARVTFAEDIAAFANADGGVLIVGVTDAAPRTVVGIGDARAVDERLKAAADALTKHLEYPRSLTTFHTVRMKDAAGVERVCLVVAVAQAAQAVGVSDNGHYSYPVRQQTGITRMSPSEIGTRKLGLMNDNHDFIQLLKKLMRN